MASSGRITYQRSHAISTGQWRTENMIGLGRLLLTKRGRWEHNTHLRIHFQVLVEKRRCGRKKTLQSVGRSGAYSRGGYRENNHVHIHATSTGGAYPPLFTSKTYPPTVVLTTCESESLEAPLNDARAQTKAGPDHLIGSLFGLLNHST